MRLRWLHAHTARQAALLMQRKIGRMESVMLEMDCFDFRVINLPNGDQVIDKAIRTPYEALEPLQMLEYTEMEREMAVMDQMRRKEKRELRRRRRNSRNPLYRLACICGLA